MDLGQGKLRRSGINTLLSASHQQHGLAWTNGKDVFLSPISITDNQLENSTSALLGTFECVQSVSWSTAYNKSIDSLLAVVHDTSVTIWKAEDVGCELTFRQVRKINVSAIPQGCLWNPVKDILCLLTLHQCNLYFRHLSDKGSFVLPNIDSNNVSCGCWSEDGRKLIIGVGSLILIYEWRDIDKVVTDYTMNAWKIPKRCSLHTSVLHHTMLYTAEHLAASDLIVARLTDWPVVHNFFSMGRNSRSLLTQGYAQVFVRTATKVIKADGRVCSVAALSSSRFVAATELPLERLCYASHVDFFQPPDFNENNGSDTISSHSDNSGHSNSGSDVELCSVSGSGSLSHVQKLLNLRRNSQSIPRCDSSQLVVFEVYDTSKTDSVRKLSSVNLPGLLCPDLLCVINQHRQVVVGSNAHHALFVFSLVDCQLKLSNEINLASNERPKGVCGHPLSNSQPGVLLMVGQSLDIHSIFVPSTTFSEYRLSALLVSTSSSPDNTGSSKKTVSFNGSTPVSDKIHTNGSARDSKLLLPCSAATNGDIYRTVDDLTGATRAIREQPVASPITVVRGVKEDGESLETEFADFKRTPAKFKSSLLQHFAGKGDKRPLLLDDGDTSVQSTSDHQTSPKHLTSLANGIVSRLISKTAGDDKKTPVAASAGVLKKSVAVVQGDGPTGGDPSQQPSFAAGRSNGIGDASVAELSHHMELLRAQLKCQVEQMSSIQLKVDHILSELSRNGPSVQRRSVMDPDLMYVVDSNGLQKAFVLDNGRLQLDVVKHAFGLTSVEIVINGVSCVVGADPAGYIPLQFAAGQTIQLAAPTVNAFRI